MANPPNPHCGRKPEHPEQTHSHGENVQTLHRQSPRLELNPDPWRCEAAVLTTVPPRDVLISRSAGTEILKNKIEKNY